MPIAQVLIEIAQSNGKLTSDSDANTFRLVVWTIQFFVGLVGIWLAGSVTIKTAKKDGWKHTPKAIWHLFRHGQAE